MLSLVAINRIMCKGEGIMDPGAMTQQGGRDTKRRTEREEQHKGSRRQDREGSGRKKDMQLWPLVT